MPTAYTWLFVGGGLGFTLGAVIAAAATLFFLWRGRISSTVHTMLQCGLMLLVYFLMAFDWWPKQRADGREFPWYRDVALLLVSFLQMWITLVNLYVDVSDAFVLLGASFFGSLALVLSNFGVANVYWYGWGAYWIVHALAYLFILAAAGRNTSWRGWIMLLASLILVIGWPLVQLLSWTMLEVFDSAPDRFISEIVYLVVTGAGIAAVGVSSVLLYRPEVYKPMRVFPEPSASKAHST